MRTVRWKLSLTINKNMFTGALHANMRSKSQFLKRSAIQGCSRGVKVRDRDETFRKRLETETFATDASSSSHGVLFLSVAVSTTDRQVSRLIVFFHADERTIFNGFKSALIAARSQI